MPAKKYVKSGQFIDQKYRKIVFKSYLAKKPVSQLYFLHGLSEHSDSYGEIFPLFIQNGISCHIMDLPGHGFSEGIRGHIDDFQEYIDNLNLFIKSNPYQETDLPTFLLGHSLGGAIAHHFTLESDTQINGLILTSPLLGFPVNNKLYSVIFQLLSKKDKTAIYPKPCSIKSLNRTDSKVDYYKTDPLRLHCITPNLYLELENYNKKSQASAVDQIIPLLIFASSKDRVVSYDATATFFENVTSKDKKIVAFGEAMHELLQEEERDQIISIATNWIKKRI